MQLPQDQLLFIDDFSSVDGYSEQTDKEETLRPGSSKASADIRQIVGSDSAVAVGAYLRAKDPELATTWDRTTAVISRYEKHRRWLSSSVWGTTSLLFLIVVLPTHFALHSPGKTLKNTLHVLLYLFGFLWSVEALIHVILDLVTVPALQFTTWIQVAMNVLLGVSFISIPVIWWRTLRFTHQASHGRLFFCVLLVAFAGVLSVMAYVLVMTWLKLPLPESNGIQRF